LQGTEILPVTPARGCEYADGCDELAIPGSTCCWRHRRHGKLFSLPAALPVPQARAQRGESAVVDGKCKCGCGKPVSAGREWFHGHKPQNAARALAVSTDARDALRSIQNFPVRSGTASADGEEIAVFNVKMTEPMLDTFWGLLDGKSKAALLSKMGAE
jgi:hypothetical protein